jgi:hypothetical protein
MEKIMTTPSTFKMFRRSAALALLIFMGDAGVAAATPLQQIECQGIYNTCNINCKWSSETNCQARCDFKFETCIARATSKVSLSKSPPNGPSKPLRPVSTRPPPSAVSNNPGGGSPGGGTIFVDHPHHGR